MLRASLALLLLVASAAVFAQNGRGIANGTTGTCQDVADRAVAERPADAVPNTSDARRARYRRAQQVRRACVAGLAGHHTRRRR